MAGDATFWREHVAQIDREGCSTKEYARRCGLSAKALYYWRRKLKAAMAAAAPGKFVTLELAPMAHPPQACVVSVGAVRLELSGLPAPAWLAALALAARGMH